MNTKAFDNFCSKLPATTHVIQWGESHVWKVCDKVFVIAGFDEDEPWFTFKVSPWAFEVLKEQPGLRPAPYLASRGLSWIQHYAKPGLSDKQLKIYIQQSYELVLKGVTKKKRIELGLM